MARKHSKRGTKQSLVERTFRARNSRHGTEVVSPHPTTRKVAAGPTLTRGKKQNTPVAKNPRVGA